MRFVLFSLAAVAALFAGAHEVEARPFDTNGNVQFNDSSDNWSDERRSVRTERGRVRRTARNYQYRDEDGESRRSNLGAGSARVSGVGSRPRAWCGWWMRTQRGGGPAFNVAWNWRNYGRSTAPQVGAVVVWRHHVGEIVGRASNGMWIVRSGNDGGTVRTRPRSVSGAVFRI